jgi:dTDP-4-amino-4,6-dideoxygalactose transaminase
MTWTVPFLDLRQLLEPDRAEIERAIGDTLSRGWFILGPALEEFERAFAQWCGADHAVGVASGTDAISLALQAVGVGAGDEVITVANTCAPTVAAIVAIGAVPVLADAESGTATIDPRSVRAAITPRTAAIVPVHLYGQCADMPAILEIARRHQLAVVEDAAQAHGARLEDQAAGTLGDAAAFSFYPTKNLGAVGDAGAVTTNDPEVAERVRAARNYGYRERDNALVTGRNSRLDDLQAAVLSVRLRRLHDDNARRRALAARYLEALRECEPITAPVQAPGREHAWHLFVVLAEDRDGLREHLAAHGVQTLVHYPRAIHRQAAFAELDRPGELEVSERLCAQVLSLPLHPGLSDSDQALVIEALAGYEARATT